MKTFCASPLPFLGQKRKYLKEVKQLLNHTSPRGTYVDLFGGSGLLSHTVKRYYPNATVVYNDYDGFYNRIANIATTNTLLDKIRPLIKDIDAKTRVPEDIKQDILTLIKAEHEANIYVDYITLSSTLLFTMKYEQTYEGFAKQTLYNRLTKTPYNADGYLEGLIIESSDYKTVFEKYKDTPEVYFLVDPPYLSTEVSGYKQNYWKLKDYLNVLNVLDEHKYLYFTSNKSQIVELCEWVESRKEKGNPFNHSHTVSMTNKSKNTTYEDILIHNITPTK
ncbi:DNA adenine methylase [Myroides odoratimimus]|uniref:DNA adenine methylase n=1 Tax=Myroides odoratimimus TaxID=76832 RepID=UPI002576AD9F|nr:DNA adenine methylase [Myroides odoratimimus]MDM1529014.1 DNA adenine methylase [Myroides odoratimimus]